ncbi:hypothetical protein EDD36DRAFT_100408 [Exophiala viscosa]|uniref:Uncharacterized protein n=1 Tax=Exophiala viscosa TaxID=2486360 RepID=A0AAN6I8S6_9EURO|nr:hypothetical protein EDD36DRAFT_100408 [Exophiala viscosa]
MAGDLLVVLVGTFAFVHSVLFHATFAGDHRHYLEALRQIAKVAKDPSQAIVMRSCTKTVCRAARPRLTRTAPGGPPCSHYNGLGRNNIRVEGQSARVNAIQSRRLWKCDS